MTTSTSNMPPKAGLVARYGPLTAIVVAITLVAVLVTVSGRETQTSAGAHPAAPAAAAGTPPVYEQAKAEGKESSINWVDNCDPATGKIKMPTVFAYPCVPRFTGSNGGETAPGVTADKITVVYYVPPTTGDVMAQLAGNLDPPEAVQDTAGKFVQMLDDLAETYGRKVEVATYQGKSSGSDAVAARAEAQEVIDKYKPFASISGPALTPAYAEELAAQGVLCFGCGGSVSDQIFQDNAPHMWGAAPTPEEWLTIVSDYIGKRLAKRPAKWAGDPALRSATRKFAVVNFDQDPPQFNAMTTTGEKCEDTTGWKFAVHETYLASDMQNRAPTIVAKLKSEKITTVAFMGDPIMPIFLTAEATKQNYFPEWIVTGTVLTDTNLFGRRFDPKQWEHAFGLSQGAVPVSSKPREQIDGWRLHQWYFGSPPAAAKTSAVIWPSIFQLFAGIHMAGPNLTPDTFKQGMFNLPPAGGGPTTPRLSYGDRQTFPVLSPDTCKVDHTIVDYLGVDDMVEVWWDPSVTGPDEQDGTDKPGKYRFVANGRRYLPGQMPDTEPDAFKVEGSVLDYKVRPDVDKAPDYPSPKR